MIAAVDTPATSPQKGRSIDELLQSVSASRLTTFHQCRLKFYFQYVLGWSGPRTAALYIGTIVHAVLQYWNKARWRNQPTDLPLLRLNFCEQWEGQQVEEAVAWEKDEEIESRDNGWALLET